MTSSPLDDGTRPTHPARFALQTDDPLRVAVSEAAFGEKDLPDRLATATAHGWQRIGLLRQSVWKFGEERLAELLQARGLRVSSLAWTGGFTGSVGFTYREAIEDGRIAVAEAKRLNAETLLVAPGARAGHTFRHAQRVVADGLRHLGDIAARQGVAIAVITAPTRRMLARWTCIDTLELAGQLLDLVDNPNVGLAVPADRWHGHPTALPALRSLAPRIRIVTSHLGRAGEVDPATPLQDLSVTPTLQLLLDGGFQGVWELEAPAEMPLLDRCEEASVLRCQAQQYSELAHSLGRRGGVRLGRW